MSGNIFINYRRDDDPGFVGRLLDRLSGEFPPDRLFMDVDSIAPGQDFVRVLEEQIAQCDVLLAVIGPRWLDAKDEQGELRLNDPNDFVRFEIESGLKLGKLIIPVLVNGAAMPRADDLPETLRPLADIHWSRLTHERFGSDVQGLVKALQSVLVDVEKARRESLYLLVQEECRKCTGGVCEVLYSDGTAVAGTILKSGADCNNRCLEKLGGKIISERALSDEEANEYYDNLTRTEERDG